MNKIVAVAALAATTPALAAPQFFSLPGSNSWRTELETLGTWASTNESATFADNSVLSGLEAHADLVFSESGFGADDTGIIMSRSTLDASIGSMLITAEVSSSVAYVSDNASGSNFRSSHDLNATGRFILLEAATVRVIAHASEQLTNSDVVAGLATPDFSTIFAAAFPGQAVDMLIDLEPGEYLFTVQAGMSTGIRTGSSDLAQSAGISIQIIPAPASGVALAGLGVLGFRRRR